MIRCVFCKDQPEACPSCEEKNKKAAERRKKRKYNRKIRDELVESLGLTKVKGVVSGKTYYE